MRHLALLLVILNCVLLCVSGAEAAKKKPSAPAVKKAIYEAPMRVVIVRNSSDMCEPKCPEWIAAEGEITGGTPAAFRKVFKQMGKKKLPVIIQSPGGSINAALEIGKMLRDRQLTVAVGFTRYDGCAPDDQNCKLPKENKGIYEGQIYEYGAFCNSACPMLLSGGTTRLASAVAYIGLHEPKTTWTHEQVRYRDYYKIVNGKKKITKRQILSRKTVYDKTTFGFDKRLRKRLTAYYKSMGVDVSIIEESQKAKYQDMNFIADDLKSKLRLRTSNDSAVLLGSPKLCGSSGTSAVCVEDKARDPKLLVAVRQKLLGLDTEVKPMTFRLVELVTGDCTNACPKMIVADGRITDTTQDNFVTFQNTVKPGQAPVVLNSDGGDLSAAMHMAQRIRMAGISTSVATLKSKAQRVRPEDIVTGTCKGACAVVFAGGYSRYLPEKQTIELFHPDLLSGGSTPKAVQLNSTLGTLDVKGELMSALHKLKGNKGLTIMAKDALVYKLATDVQPVMFVVGNAQCKNIAGASMCNGSTEVVLPQPLTKEQFGGSEMKPIMVVAPTATCSTSCPVWIAASGTITKETQRRFSALLERYGHLQPPIILSSQGGSGAAAIEIAKLIRNKGLTVILGETAVEACLNGNDCGQDRVDQKYFTGVAKAPGRCEGACVLLFAGSEARGADYYSKISIANIDDMDVASTSKQAQQIIELYFRSLGITDRLARTVSNIIPNRTYRLSDGEFGLVNSTKGVYDVMNFRRCTLTPKPKNCINIASTQ